MIFNQDDNGTELWPAELHQRIGQLDRQIVVQARCFSCLNDLTVVMPMSCAYGPVICGHCGSKKVLKMNLMACVGRPDKLWPSGVVSLRSLTNKAILDRANVEEQEKNESRRND